ncbi:CoA transferase [Pseudomonas gingeri]|nr:CoA transferase [Pseudomonas gingeri]
MSGPLSGMTVIEMAGIGPTPFGGMMLADMGAEVICIDRPAVQGGGVFDELKNSANVVGRGRRSVILDLKQQAGIEALLRLIDKADAVIEGFRPGVMERLGLGPQICLARNPALVYGRMTGWGQDGPLALSAGHDLNYVALSGALYGIGPNDRPPVVPLNLIGDYGGGGLLLAFGVVCALLEANRSGKGQIVDTAMSDGSATLMSMIYGLHAQGYWSTERESNFLDGAAHFYGTYACADGGFVSIAAIEPQFYRLLLERLEIDDEAFQKQWSKEQWGSLREKLTALFLTRERAHWCELLENSDACFSPVLDLHEAPQHPHNVARQTFVEIAGVTQPAPAPRFSRTPGVIRSPAPKPGTDTSDILSAAGYSPRELAALLAIGAAHVQ